MAITNDEWDKIDSRIGKAVDTLEHHIDLRIGEIKENIEISRKIVTSVMLPLTVGILIAITAGIIKIFFDGGS